jgi:hypothetical protein
MEDLRKSFNVKKSRTSAINLIGFFFTNRRLFRSILILALTVTVIFFPTFVGQTVSTWMNDLYTSFMANNTISLETWAITMGTILCFILFHGLLKWINRN